MLPLLLSLSLPLTDSISFSCGVERVDRAIADLSVVAHHPMRTTEPLSSEVVYLQLRNLSLAEAMKTLADSTCGQWSTDKDGAYVLSRPDWMVSVETAKETTRRLKLLEAWRAQFIRCLDAPYDYDSLVSDVKLRATSQAALYSGQGADDERETLGNRVAELDNLDPACRALARCLVDFDLTPVAQLAPQAGATYAFQPNATQSALSTSARACLASLQPEQLVFGKALRAATPFGDDSGEDHRFVTDDVLNAFKDSDPSLGAPLSPWTRSLPYTRAPVYALLSFYCYSEDTYRCEFRLFDSHSKVILSLSLDNLSTFESPPPPGNLKTQKPPAASRETQAFWARWGAKPKEVPALIEVLRKELEDPVDHDPVAFGNQELLDEFARQTSKSLIVCLPDSLVMISKDDFSLDTYVNSWASKGLARVETGSLVEFKPSNFAYHWQHHLDRHGLADCAKAVERNHRLDLATYVRLCATGSNEGNSVVATVGELLDPTYSNARPDFSLPFQSAFIPLFASLTKDEVELLKAGGTIPYDHLSPQQLAWVTDILYGVRINVGEEGSSEVDSELGPTIELPAGALQGAGLTASFHTDQVVKFIDPSTGDTFFTVNLDTNPEPFGWSGPPPRIPAGGMDAAVFRVDDEEAVTLKCALRPGHSVVGRFTSPDRQTGVKPVGVAQLPDDLQKRLKSFIKVLSDMANPGRQGQDGGKGP